MTVIDIQHINEAMLTIIAGALSMGVKYLHVLVLSIKELNLKMSQIVETIRDHETRIRVVESKTYHKES
jgi:hypothetical protein